MNRLLASIASAATIALAAPSAAHALQSPETAPAVTTAFDKRAAELVDLFAGKIAFSDYFAPSFQQAIPETQFKAMTTSLIAQYGPPVAVEQLASKNGRSGTLQFRFEKGVGTVLLDVGADAGERVIGLQLTDFRMANDSYDRVAAELAALPGSAGFLVAQLDGATIRPLAAANADRQFAVGSTFKLYVLDELGAQIAAGERRWSDVVPFSHPSFSSAGTANWPTGTPVTLQTLANWMISVSDNGATDTLIHLLGRGRIEARIRAAGHSDPSRNIPLLTTVEAFALKGNNFSDLRPAFIEGDDQAQRKLIDANRARLILANVDGISFIDGPRFINSLEWFASPNDIARALVALRARKSGTVMSVLAINNGVGPAAAEPWRYLGYKGGSENGVLSMSVLGERKADGKWFVVTASWNDPKANLDADKMVGLVTRLLALAAK
ncbi:beta-lactamase class A [Sphingopyxis panaciterrae]|uniref:serine hydrolase n=1 Tax=Sphingopyxis panaciterrae TaxID=363841 RepID=UPI00141F208E|nr:serine hydrolase [Sphingopyxis panaciterrae]NIJ36891.1 beta-lactamase class A [Sphingopyxis panaciterrae]